MSDVALSGMMDIAKQDNLTIDALQRQLAAARYTFHKVTLKRYADAVNLGIVVVDPGGNEAVVKMPHEQAKEMYRMAMENYDGIIRNAVSGASAEANQASMDDGFKI